MKKRVEPTGNNTDFKLLFPFEIKEATEDTGAEVITIEGFANYSGNCEDEYSCYIDRSNEVVVPAGVSISNYKKNPVILMNHDRSRVIGKAISVTKKADGIFVKAEIHEGACDSEDFYSIKNGLISSFSIGFRSMAGEYKEVNKRSVYFVTKSELFETSCVSIPCNAASGFSIVKSLGDGSFYSEDTPNAVPGAGATHKSTEDNYMKMQIKLRDMLSEDKVKELEDLGLGESLDELKDVDAKAYLESLVAKQLAVVQAEVAELRAELTKAAEAPAEGETKEEEKPAASEEETKADDEANEETKEDDQEVVSKSLTETSSAVANLLALYTAE